MRRPSVAGSAGDDLALKFLFANQEGLSVALRFHKTAVGADVKAQLMQNWPPELPPAENAKAIRLICMGRGLLKDTQTLEQSKIPAFSTHPTPVNVSVLRKPPPPMPMTAPASAVKATAAPGVSRGATPHSRGSAAEVSIRTTAGAPLAHTPGCGCTIM